MESEVGQPEFPLSPHAFRRGVGRCFTGEGVGSATTRGFETS
jgi:hypothetical protein